MGKAKQRVHNRRARIGGGFVIRAEVGVHGHVELHSQCPATAEDRDHVEQLDLGEAEDLVRQILGAPSAYRAELRDAIYYWLRAGGSERKSGEGS